MLRIDHLGADQATKFENIPSIGGNPIEYSNSFTRSYIKSATKDANSQTVFTPDTMSYGIKIRVDQVKVDVEKKSITFNLKLVSHELISLDSVKTKDGLRIDSPQFNTQEKTCSFTLTNSSPEEIILVTKREKYSLRLENKF